MVIVQTRLSFAFCSPSIMVRRQSVGITVRWPAETEPFVLMAHNSSKLRLLSFFFAVKTAS
jgi:hypothetical protein